MNVLLFLGIQLLSVVTAVAVLMEYRRVCGKRAEFFKRLGSSTGTHMQLTLVSLYVLSMLLVFFVSSYVFILHV